MKELHDRAFKEWALACEALRDGRQILLIRKGGIREDGGVFTMNDDEFFLMPTYEHQKVDMLNESNVADLERMQAVPQDWNSVTIDTYAVVDTILLARDMDQVRRAANEHIWNEKYLNLRFDFNPYDPLYLVILRAYRMREPQSIPVTPEYIGCRSWVTLEIPISTVGAIAAIDEEAFAARRRTLVSALASVG